MASVLFRALDHDVICSAFFNFSIPSREIGNSAGKSSAWMGTVAAFVDNGTGTSRHIDLIDAQAFVGVLMIRLGY